jgi:hypothetical protein
MHINFLQYTDCESKDMAALAIATHGSSGEPSMISDSFGASIFQFSPVTLCDWLAAGAGSGGDNVIIREYAILECNKK